MKTMSSQTGHAVLMMFLALCSFASLAGTKDPIASDPVSVDAQFPPRLAPVTIKSGDALLNGRALLADGKGPHPTILLLHGLPGNELNMDVAQSARRAGWNVFMFHYRGSWGSGGDFSINNVVADTTAALSHVRSLSPDSNWRVDGKRIVLVGHSMGGFAALVVGSGDTGVKSIASISGADLGKTGRYVFTGGAAEEKAYESMGCTFAKLLTDVRMLKKKAV